MKLEVVRMAQITELDISADEWELFTCTELAACEEAAKKMNFVLRGSVNSGDSRREVEMKMNRIMHEFSSLGALDSEPRWKLEKILDKIFGEEG